MSGHGLVRSVRTNRRAVVWGVVTTVGVFSLFVIVTGLIPNALYVRMVPRTPVDYLFLTLTAILAGIYVTQHVANPVEGDRLDGMSGCEDAHTHTPTHDGGHIHGHTHDPDHRGGDEHEDSEHDGGTGTDRLAFGGLLGGFLAVGCPICNVFLLALFSSSALMTYFDPLRPLLGAVSVALLAGLVYVRHRRSCPLCAS